jgi:hypothetical protein
MPAHSVLAATTLVVVSVTSFVALAYAWIRPVRRVLRWPLVVGSAAAGVLVVLTGEAGKTLLRTVEASASAAEVAAAQAHAHGTDDLALSVFCLLITVVVTGWGVLRPNRERWTAGMWIGALVLASTAVVALVTGGLVLDAALDAVALGNA